MLPVASSPNRAFPRLLLQGVRAKAWIEHKPWRYGHTDWQLWIERNGTLSRAKCPLRIEIESLLRSWLLRECKMPLSTLSYTELRLIAEGMWAGDEFQVRAFKRAGEWVPQLFALAREDAGARLH